MPNFPSVFPLWHIALTAAIAFGVSVAVLWLVQRRGNAMPFPEMIFLALVVALSIVAWRSAANVPSLNDDPIPPFSPNDLLCPVVTYVCLELGVAFRPPTDAANWGKARALLTLVSLVVNVLVI